MKYILLLFMFICNSAFALTESIGVSFSGTDVAYATSGSTSNIIDDDYNTSYYAYDTNNTESGTIYMTSTVTLSSTIRLNTIRIKVAYLGGGTTWGAGGECKLYDSSDVLIDTIDSFTASGSGSSGTITRDNTYTTGWNSIKKIVLRTYAGGGSRSGGDQNVWQYEISGEYSDSGNYIISFL